MTDEPILCFDGDGAGLRAARRAVDLAMPHLKPGKSLKVALLPQGQDPDDLLRSAGPDAVRDVVNAAQPMAQMLWQFMTEGHDFGTPERRAALESRINEVTQTIADESVRKYYRQDFNERLRAFFAPAQSQGFVRGNFGGQRGNFGGQGGRQGSWQPRLAGQRGGPSRAVAGGPYVVASQQMAASPVHRGHRTAVPTREALILQAAVNYPWLLHDHLEELSQLEFRHAEAERLKAALIDVAAHAADHAAGLEPDTLRAELAARGLTEAMDRVFASVTNSSVWGVRPDAAPDDVLVTWQQLVALHRQWHSLTRELREAELALGQEATEANYLRLRDVKDRLASVDGTEALIEGFGASSGRGARTL